MAVSGAYSNAKTLAEGETPGTVQRVLHTIQYFAQYRESSLKEMSDALKLPPSTCHRLLDILRREGFIDTVPDKKKYRVGTELIRVCAEIWSQQDLSSIAIPFLKQMSGECGESTVLSLYLPAKKMMCYAAKVDSPAALRFEIKLNRPTSIIWGASGLSIAAFLPPGDVDIAYANEGPSPASGAKLPTRDELEERLIQVRRTGYSITFGEKMLGSTGIGAPVFQRAGVVVGSLLIVYPSARLSDDRRETLARLLCDLAERLSTLIVDRTVEGTQP